MAERNDERRHASMSRGQLNRLLARSAKQYEHVAVRRPVDARLAELFHRGEMTCSRCRRPLPEARTLEIWRLEREARGWEARLRAAGEARS